MSVDFAALKLPARERLRLMLWDLAWHGHSELHRVGGVRYSARVLELKRLGYEIETQGERENGLQYRLVSHDPGAPQEKRVKIFLTERDALWVLSLAKQRGPDLANAVRAIGDAIGSFNENRGKL